MIGAAFTILVWLRRSFIQDATTPDTHRIEPGAF